MGKREIALKFLITNNFSFSHGVFKRPVLQTREYQGLFGKRLLEFQTNDDDCNSEYSKVTKRPNSIKILILLHQILIIVSQTLFSPYWQ